MFPGATEAHALPFATTNYEADEDGTLHAVLPSRCVYARGEQTCVMFVDHYRKRKTGPCYPIAVVGCRVHGRRRYTLYPAGHYPYGRVAVVAYSADGELLWEADRGGLPWPLQHPPPPRQRCAVPHDYSVATICGFRVPRYFWRYHRRCGALSVSAPVKTCPTQS